MGKTILIDAGHGGMHEGKYMTNKKDGKFYDHGEFIAYEGVTNREIAKRLMSKLGVAGIPYVQIHHDYLDVPSLSMITDAANNVARQRECVFLSIHSNAGKGNGFEVWTSVGDTPADPLAEMLCERLKKDFPEYPLRADKYTDVGTKDQDKERDYWVLKHTICPAVLPELLFFDEINQAKFLNSPEGQERLAESLFKWCKSVV